MLCLNSGEIIDGFMEVYCSFKLFLMKQTDNVIVVSLVLQHQHVTPPYCVRWCSNLHVFLSNKNRPQLYLRKENNEETGFLPLTKKKGVFLHLP